MFAVVNLPSVMPKPRANAANAANAAMDSAFDIVQLQFDTALDRTGVLTIMKSFGCQAGALLMQAQPTEHSFRLDANL